jgi:hypothetical protein
LKKNENLWGNNKQLQEIIRAIKKHETVYKKMDYWRKEKILVQKDFLGNPCSYPRLLVLCGHGGGTQHAVAVLGSSQQIRITCKSRSKYRLGPFNT